METMHVHVIRPAGTEGILGTARGSKFFLTLPDHEPIELPAMLGAKLAARFDEPDHIELEFFGTLEVTYS